jgi:hypothetical protein
MLNLVFYISDEERIERRDFELNNEEKIRIIQVPFT